MRTRVCMRNIVLAALIMILAGCTGVGPGTVARDRFDYTAAISESWKRQMLLNIIKLRYGDAPIFLDVTSIINQYQFSTDLNASLGWQYPSGPTIGFGNGQHVGMGAGFVDRPTISYAPLTGDKFARSFMTPVAPASVMSLIEGGYPVDLVFRVLVHSINGIQNSFGGSARARKADPEFYVILDKLRRIQAKGAVSLRVKKVDNRDTLMMIFSKRVDNETAQDGKEVRRILGLKEGGSEFRIVYGSAPANDDEVALLTRSMTEVLLDISGTVAVPAEHVAEKRVLPTMEPDGEGIKGAMIHILCSNTKPDDDFSAVQYRDRWFWIDDRDFLSKRLFSFLLFSMTLTETGGKEGAPIVTINAGG